jgi:hypothetical protein
VGVSVPRRHRLGILAAALLVAAACSSTASPAAPGSTGATAPGSTVGAVSTTPTASGTPTGARWVMPLDVSWHWMIDHPLDLGDDRDMGRVDPSGRRLAVPEPTVYDIDWEYNPASTVAALHALGKKVICYVDVGAFEDYRPDAARFPAAVRGAKDSHWEGSFWLDIRRMDVLLPIMEDRIRTCRDKGFDAVEPDEVDGYANESGFPLTAADQLAYNRAIADLVHRYGMSVGLKGDIDQAAELAPSFDWTLNEQCYQFDECDVLTSAFLARGKAVLIAEYDDPGVGYAVDLDRICPKANAAGYNAMKMPLGLDGGRWPCR